jgi:hypothetical protein
MYPNFTGVWQLIRGESDFGFLPQPSLRIDTTEHEDVQLRVRTCQKDANGSVIVDRNLTIGDQAVEVVILGRARWIRAFWDEAALVIETNSEVSGAGRKIEDRWTLDTGAEWLTIQRLHELPGGAVRQRLRLQRRSQVIQINRRTDCLNSR